MGSKTNIYTPFFALDVARDNARNTTGDDLPVVPLFIGQKTAGGSATDGSIHEVLKLADVETLAGKGSHLYAVMDAYFKRRSTTRVAIGVLADGGTATAATRSLTVTGTPSTAGTLYFRLNGEKFGIAVAVTDTATTIGDKIVTAVGDDSSVSGRRVSADNTGGVVTFTASNKGLAVGRITLYYNPDVTDEAVEGLVVTVGALTAGTEDPDVDTVFGNIGDAHYYLMLSPYADSVSLGKAEAVLDVLGDKYNARDGIYVAPSLTDDTVSNLKNLAAGVASKYVAILDTYYWQDDNESILGVLGREVSISVKEDVNRPLHNLVLPDLVGPIAGNERVWEDRNELASFGVATLDPDKLTFEAPVTSYIATAEERRWENIYNLASLRISFKSYILNKYARAKLKVGDEEVNPDQVIINPTIGRSEAVQWYRGRILRAQVEDMNYFVANMVVTVDDVDTINWFLPVTLVGQFVVGTGTQNYILGGNV